MQNLSQKLLFLGIVLFSINLSYAVKTKNFYFQYGVGITNVTYVYNGYNDAKNLSTPQITQSSTRTSVVVTAALPNDKSIANSFIKEMSYNSGYMVGLTTTDQEPKKMDWWIQGILSINGYVVSRDFTLGLDDNSKNFWLGTMYGLEYSSPSNWSNNGIRVNDQLGNIYCLRRADWYIVNVNFGPCTNLNPSQAEQFTFFYGTGIRDVSFTYSGEYDNSYLGAPPTENKTPYQTTISLIAKMDNSTNIAVTYNQTLNSNPKHMLNLSNPTLSIPTTLDLWVKGSLKINGKEVAPDLVLGSINNNWWVGSTAGYNIGEWEGLTVHDADGIYYCLKTQTGRYNAVHVILNKCNNFIHVATQQIGAKDGTSIANAIIAESNNNNLFVVGSTTRPLTPTIIESGNQDYFLAKHDKTGKLLWLTQIGAKGATATAKALTQNGKYIFVVGSTTGGLYGQKQYGKRDYFIHKYSLSGALQWPIQYGAAGGDTRATSVVSDSEGYTYVVGYTDVPLRSHKQNGDQDLFIHQYAGNFLSGALQAGGNGGITRAYGIATNKHNIYVVGSTTVPIYGQIQNQRTDAFIVAYAGSYLGELWAKQFTIPGAAYNYASSISTDSSGNLYVAGYTLDVYQYTQNYFVAKFDSQGNMKWTRVGKGAGATAATAIKVDAYGNVYVAGYTDSGLFGEKQNGHNDYFIARYDQFGKLHAIDQVGNTAPNLLTTTNGLGITVDNLGMPFIVGTTNVGITQQQSLATGIFDYFIASYLN